MNNKTHPLALKKTELIWEGKYDAEGRRVAPLRVALPFQTVETVNESTQERQKNLLFKSSTLWQTQEFTNKKSEVSSEPEARRRDYVDFILKLYQAKPIHGYAWLHGLRGGRMIHVGAVDAPVTVGDVPNIAAEFRQGAGNSPH